MIKVHQNRPRKSLLRVVGLALPAFLLFAHPGCGSRRQLSRETAGEQLRPLFGRALTFSLNENSRCVSLFSIDYDPTAAANIGVRRAPGTTIPTKLTKPTLNDGPVDADWDVLLALQRANIISAAVRTPPAISSLSDLEKLPCRGFSKDTEIVIRLTPTAAERSRRWRKTGASSYEIDLSTPQFDEVGGISQGASANEAAVEFTYHWEPTSEGVALGYSTGRKVGSARFTLFDDGWRVDRSTVAIER